MPEYRYPGYGPASENWLTPRAKTKGGYHGGTDNPAKPGTYSSDITHKADPDAFDIDRPVFPYQNGEPKPALPPGSTLSPGAAPLSSSGMAIPGAEGPTSLGGSNGPAPLRAPTSSRSQSPALFPLEALLARDPNRAWDQWASLRRDVSSRAPGVSAGPSAPVDSANPDQAPAGGLLSLIRDHMRNNGY
ncbi:hypothetical protein [Bradyrhizobium commune]|uniref:Uncharacterized protein n=1 Tax=Bradyrhizobium commune TaxID=83627 RepID=A0A7S9D9Q8_9BRAD|nr:hypothetical protein [Bradyrhizobium commune]QPF93762.1 hypothetical protein IC761_11065 [Bradyrhizobium commune]